MLPLARVVESAGETLRRGGRIIYLGSSCPFKKQKYAMEREGETNILSKLKVKGTDRRENDLQRRKSDFLRRQNGGGDREAGGDSLRRRTIGRTETTSGGEEEAAEAAAEAAAEVAATAEADVGILSLIDASECHPTFGADFEDLRGFLRVRNMRERE